ncbi:hypothetical protein [Flavobacterium sp.]|jgi:hypothetical protein|uniref:hypothetical protein n=1 Tax=Flavobacterium sp. TaxID=239 RepID=UPI00260AC9F0|nr:hypothetical protein [Flavobacterium sp.]MDD2987272.1 hypothetical protein [Flavobacterium sp.]
MNQELLKQAKAMFDSPEKWNAFLELVWQKDEIRNQWFLKLKEEANKKFSTEEFVEGWVFNSWGVWDLHWYQKEHGDKSIGLLIGWWGEMTLYCNGEFYDTVKIHDLLRSERFAPLLSCFNRIDRFYEGGRLAIETRNFSFDSPHDTKFDADRLGWYAGNRTEDFLNQIAAKVNRYRKDEEMNSLLHELNLLTKINRE